MKYSDITKLKILAQDKISRSANPAIVRNSTVFFKSMQELLDKEKIVKKGSKVNFYEYGRAGSQTTIALQNFITELGLAKSSTKLLPKRSTLIAITGATLGQTSINEIEVCTNQSVVAIKPCKKISPEFVFLWVQKNVNYLINSQTGGAQQHINKNNVNEMKILLPSKEIMEIFGNIVKPIFDKISINLFESDTLSTLREEILPKLVSGELSISDAEKIIEKVGI